jgi:hypothetical protein
MINSKQNKMANKFLLGLFFICGLLIHCTKTDGTLYPDQQYSSQNHADNRIQPWGKNPWYWQYKGEPVLLLGASNDHNLFQWEEDKLIPHLDLMVAAGANYVRNTMSDRSDDNLFHSPADQVVPNSSDMGFKLYPFLKTEEGKYDLDQWNDAYWERFEFFLKETEKRDIIVQIEVWDRFDYWSDYWLVHPYNPKNNVNYTLEETGLKIEYTQHPASNQQPFFFTTPKQQNNITVLKFQKKFVEKMLSFSLNFDHVLYCMDNETEAEEEWAIYWAELIKEKALETGVKVCMTEMWGNLDLKSEIHRRTFDHPERYAFCDVSQNTWQNGQVQWDNFQWARDYLSSKPRPINTVKTYGSARNAHGLERWWRHVIGGAASARFHRPPHGLGLSELSVTAVKAVREIESVVRFWELSPGNETLSQRDENEAYLTSEPGKNYVLYFPNYGKVGLDLKHYSSNFTIKWLELSTAEWKLEDTISGGKIVELETPGTGSWVAVIYKKSLKSH